MPTQQIALAHASWPAPADRDAGDRLAGTFRRPWGSAGAAAARSRASLPCCARWAATAPICPTSPSARRRRCAGLWRSGPDAVATTALRDVARTPSHRGPAATLAATLRQAKRRVALATALADIGGVWPLRAGHADARRPGRSGAGRERRIWACARPPPAAHLRLPAGAACWPSAAWWCSAWASWARAS